MKFPKLLLAAGLASALAGCALTEDRIDVVHNAPPGVSRISGAEARPVNVVVADARTLDHASVGNKINAYGEEMAAIRIDRDVSDIVKEAVMRELAARGYPQTPDGRQVHVQIDKFYASFTAGMLQGRAGADVTLTVWVSGKDGKILFNRRIEGHANRNVQLASGANARATLEVALDDAMTQLMASPGFVEAVGTGS